eukprot:IDg20150t1
MSGAAAGSDQSAGARLIAAPDRAVRCKFRLVDNGRESQHACLRAQFKAKIKARRSGRLWIEAYVLAVPCGSACVPNRSFNSAHITSRNPIAVSFTTAPVEAIARGRPTNCSPAPCATYCGLRLRRNALRACARTARRIIAHRHSGVGTGSAHAALIAAFDHGGPRSRGGGRAAQWLTLGYERMQLCLQYDTCILRRSMFFAPIASLRLAHANGSPRAREQRRLRLTHVRALLADFAHESVPVALAAHSHPCFLSIAYRHIVRAPAL